MTPSSLRHQATVRHQATLRHQATVQYHASVQHHGQAPGFALAITGLWTILAGVLGSESALAQTEVHHHLSFAIGAEAATVTTTLRGLSGASLTVAMPRFQPHAARLVDHGKQHGSLTLTTAAGTKAIRRNGAWTIATHGKTTLVLVHSIPLTGRQVAGGLGQRQPHKFTVEGETKTVRYFQGYSLPAVRTWLYSVARPEIPQRISFDLPAGFDVASGLPRHPDNSYRVDDFAALADSPFHIGTFRSLEFEAAGRSYRVHLTGFERDRTDLGKFQAQLTKIANSQQSILGPSTQKTYVYLLGRSTGLRTAVGHHGCTEYLTHSLRDSAAQLRDLSRAHLWSWLHHLEAPHLNQPPCGPQSWFLLGVTEYLAELSLVRAGLSEAERFWLTTISSHINKLQRDKKRLNVSVTDAGIRLYSAGPKQLPAGPDPRTKGLLLGLLLDIEIRASSHGTRSLDDVVQALVGRRIPVTNAAIAKACGATLGKPLSNFFTAYVQGTEELPLQASLARIGIGARPGKKKNPNASKTRIPQSSRRRPPRWYVSLIDQPGDLPAKLRKQITAVVAK